MSPHFGAQCDDRKRVRQSNHQREHDLAFFVARFQPSKVQPRGKRERGDDKRKREKSLIQDEGVPRCVVVTQIDRQDLCGRTREQDQAQKAKRPEPSRDTHE